MRKVITLLSTVFFALQLSYAASSPFSREPLATEVVITIWNSTQKITVDRFVRLSPNEYRKITGKKLSLLTKIELRQVQNQYRNAISKNGTINMDKLSKPIGGGDFHLGGYALGLFLGPIGVIVAYLIQDDYRRERIKWAWLGFLALAAILAAAAVLTMY